MPKTVTSDRNALQRREIYGSNAAREATLKAQFLCRTKGALFFRVNDKGFERIALYPSTMTVKSTLNDTTRVVAERVTDGDGLKGRTTYDRERTLVIPFITVERVIIHDQPVEHREIE